MNVGRRPRRTPMGTSRNPHILKLIILDEFFHWEVEDLSFGWRVDFRLVMFFGVFDLFFRVFRPIPHAPHAPLLSSVTQRLKLYTHALRMVCALARALPMQRNVFPHDCAQSPNTCSTRARIFDRALLRA